MKRLALLAGAAACIAAVLAGGPGPAEQPGPAPTVPTPTPTSVDELRRARP